LVNSILQLRLLFWRQVFNGDVHDVANFRHLDSTRGSHQACQKVCWHKIGTSRQAHSKPKGAGLTRAMNLQSVPVNFSWNWQRKQNSQITNLELVGWYQTVPYLRLESQSKWYIATISYLSTI
jgi:hypothetical protein